MKLKEYDTECIKAAHAILANDSPRHITIEGLALEVGLNRNKLQFGFKKLYGHSIDEYRLKTRMRYASKLLRQTDKSVKEIARLTGYKNISSFSVAFKREFRQPPTQWRNNGPGILR
jgi:AraC family transcriptional regulator, transcriptional activator of the genes for pyochelin and ferripyochelin receptors